MTKRVRFAMTPGRAGIPARPGGPAAADADAKGDSASAQRRPAPARARLDWVDTGRGLAIALVALFHATSWIAGTGLDVALWADVNTVLSSLRMPLFFALSGLFAAKWLTASWRDLLGSKVLLFVWVLMVWSLIGMIVQLAGLSIAGNAVNVLAGARGVVLALFNPPFELWFIWALGLFFVLARATRLVPPVLQLVAAGALSAFGLTVWLQLTTGLTGSAKFYFFFLCGLYLRSWILAFASARAAVLLSVVVVWAAVSTALFVFDLRGFPGAYFLNGVLGVLAGVAVSRALSRIRLLERLGRQTLPIYLAHTPIIIAIASALVLLPVVVAALQAVSWLVPPLVAGLAIAGALALHAACRRGVLRFLYEPPSVWVRTLKDGR